MLTHAWYQAHHSKSLTCIKKGSTNRSTVQNLELLQNFVRKNTVSNRMASKFEGAICSKSNTIYSEKRLVLKDSLPRIGDLPL